MAQSVLVRALRDRIIDLEARNLKLERVNGDLQRQVRELRDALATMLESETVKSADKNSVSLPKPSR
jgi:chaperonin cofactor prefoldin